VENSRHDHWQAGAVRPPEQAPDLAGLVKHWARPWRSSITPPCRPTPSSRPPTRQRQQAL